MDSRQEREPRQGALGPPLTGEVMAWEIQYGLRPNTKDI